jgi:hypothetical protein
MLITFLWSNKLTNSIKLQVPMDLELRKLLLIMVSTKWELSLRRMSHLVHIFTVAIGLWDPISQRILLTNIRKLRLRRERRMKVPKWWRMWLSTRLLCQTSSRISMLKKIETSTCWRMVTSTVDKFEISRTKHLATERTAWPWPVIPKKVLTHKWWE